jgi:hypothetical protein
METKTKCPICKAEKKPYNATCTRSACQEAAYYVCVARNARKGSVRKRELEQQAFAAITRATPFASIASVAELAVRS